MMLYIRVSACIIIIVYGDFSLLFILFIDSRINERVKEERKKKTMQKMKRDTVFPEL